MRTPGDIPGSVPAADTTPPRTTSKSKRGGKKSDGGPAGRNDQPSTDPTRLRFKEDVTNGGSSVRKRRVRVTTGDEGNDVSEGGGAHNPLSNPSQGGAASFRTSKTTGSEFQQLGASMHPAGLDELRGADDDSSEQGDAGSTLSGPVSGGGDHQSWGALRAEIRHSKFNTLSVYHPEKVILGLIALPVVMSIVLFAVFFSDFNSSLEMNQTPKGHIVVEDGIALITHLLDEQFAAQNLQFFHLTPAQQASLQASQGNYPLFPDTDTGNYYSARVAYEEAITVSDRDRVELWLHYLDIKTDLAGTGLLLEEAFREVLLEKTRLQVRSGLMSKTDKDYSTVLSELLKFFQGLWFRDGIAPTSSDRTLPLRIAGLLGRAAALEAKALAIQLGFTLQGNTSTILLPGGAEGFAAFVKESSLEETFQIRYLSRYVDGAAANAQLSDLTKRLQKDIAHAADVSFYDTESWGDNSASSRQSADEMISLSKESASALLKEMRSSTDLQRVGQTRFSILILTLGLAVIGGVAVTFLVVTAKKNVNKEREIRDLEKAMDRMKTFVRRLANFDIGVISTRVPRSAPQQELMLRQYLTPMKELVDYIPMAITYAPECVQDSQLTPDGLWMKSTQFSFMPKLAIVRIDTSQFHTSFHGAGSKQRTIQHQSQAILKGIEGISTHFGCHLNIFTDHTIVYVNLYDEVEDPAAVGMSIAFQVRRLCEQRQITVLRCALAMGSAYVGFASTRNSSEPCAPLNFLTVTGSVIAESEALSQAAKVHNCDIICSERIHKSAKAPISSDMDLFQSYNAKGSGQSHQYVSDAAAVRAPSSHQLKSSTTAGGGSGGGGGQLYQDDLEFRPLEMITLNPMDGFVAAHRPSLFATAQDGVTDEMQDFNPGLAAEPGSSAIYEISSSKLSDMRASIVGASTNKNPVMLEWRAAFAAYRVALDSKENMQNALGLLTEFEARYQGDVSALRLLGILLKKSDEEGNAKPNTPLSTRQDELRAAAVLSFLVANN